MTYTRPPEWGTQAFSKASRSYVVRTWSLLGIRWEAGSLTTTLPGRVEADDDHQVAVRAVAGAGEFALLE